MWVWLSSSESAGFLLGFFTALIGSSSIPTEKCEVCTCAIYHGPQIIEAEGPLGVDIYNFIKAEAEKLRTEMKFVEFHSGALGEIQ